MPAAAAAFAAAAAPARDAHAQSLTPTQRLDGALWIQPLAVEPDSMPHVEGTRVPGQWNWNAGFAFSFLERPYRAREPVLDAMGRPTRDMEGRPATRDYGLVDYQFWTHYLLQLGITSNMAVALDLPVMLYQNGDYRAFGQASPPAIAFGDVRLVYRWSTRSQAPSGPRPANAPANRSVSDAFTNEGPGLTGVLAVTAPTGDARALTGAGAWQVHPQIVGDFRLFGLIGAAQLGYRARFDQYWPSQSGSCEMATTATTNVGVSCLANVPLHDALTWNVGLRVPQGLLFGIASLYIEALGAIDMRTPIAPNTQPVTLGYGAQRVFGEVTLTLGMSSGLSDVPGNPRFAAMFMVQWAPRFLDEDGDGLRDNTGEDQCVGLPEDRDGYQDNDGCPEENDNDEVTDTEDRCPRQDEDVDGFQDEDGCPDPDNDGDGVLDARDQCADVAMGANPDPARPGCPNEDPDGDTVRGAEDQCPTVPRGDHPDPARAGCPAEDRDRDGVPDAADACPEQPAGHGATPAQRGCPDPDRDHDGVLNEADRCADQAETINGVDDGDGCPEPATPPLRNARARVRIVGASAASPGSVELLEPVRFTAADQVDRASEPVLAQLALALLATARLPARHHTLTVAPTPATVTGPLAVNAARAERRRDAVIAALRARGVPEWALRPAPVPAAPRTPPRVDRGVVIETVSAPAQAGAPSGGASAPPNNAPPNNAPPNNAAPAR